MDLLVLKLLFLASLSLCPILSSAATFKEFLYPNFTASNLGYVESSGAFLYSSNDGTYKAAMFNPGGQQSRFYLCIIHVESNSITWSANRGSPVSKSGSMGLTTQGLTVFEGEGGNGSKWSTPPLQASVYALRLSENGNLVLLDRSNTSLWESFDDPSDTIVIGQVLPLKTVLKSSASIDDLSSGDYELVLTESDAVLRWQGLRYWKVSMDGKAYVNSNDAVAYMFVNQTGFFLMGRNGSTLIVGVDLPFSEFRAAKIDYTGQFVVASFSSSSYRQEFVGPADRCSIPYTCGRLGLCNSGVSLNGPTCSCPSGFAQPSSNRTNGCVPSDSSYTLPASCNNSTNDGVKSNVSNLSYFKLGSGSDYFGNSFNQPTTYEVNVSLCEDLCTNDCACLGFFYQNYSGSCYALRNVLGSLISTSKGNKNEGYIKTVIATSNIVQGGTNNASSGNNRYVAVLLPIGVVLFLLAIAILSWRRFVSHKASRSSSDSQSSGDLELFSIMGLPSRFDYEELRLATEDFKTKIGTGGFGTVYKGVLRDKTPVAVKKITDVGVRAKKDFWTEVAIIGNIHHVNLVKLKGYCAQRRQWLLVYEYMNRGSLDGTLFSHNRPVLEWEERVSIALGSARGLAYLHNGCEKRIVHCDVKPENILLHNQFHAKISDFGLSKLLNREQSGLITTMRGTRGYLAPEWLTSSAVTDKTDVYSFGMVLLELVSGRRNCSSHTRSQSLEQEQRQTNSSNNVTSNSVSSETDYFPLYAFEMHKKGTYLELVDLRLKDRVTNEEVGKLVRVALCCIHEEPNLRPMMANVVGVLEGEAAPGVPRVESLHYLRFYGRRFAEASTVEGSGNELDEVIVYGDRIRDHHSVDGNNNMNNNEDNDARFSYVESQQVSGPR